MDSKISQSCREKNLSRIAVDFFSNVFLAFFDWKIDQKKLRTEIYQNWQKLAQITPNHSNIFNQMKVMHYESSSEDDFP